VSQFSNLLVKKPLALLIKEAEETGGEDIGYSGGGHGLKRSLGPVNLIMLGIGAVIGAGIFSLTGAAAAHYAGPGIVYSFVIGGILCALAGLCYAEMAAMVPISGSAYSYSYATMGELIAWIIGWDLILEYTFACVAVAVSWSGYLYSLLTKTLHITFPDWAIRLTKSPWETVVLNGGAEAPGMWNVPASFIGLLVALILYRGIKESAWVNNLIVVMKVIIVIVFIILGWSVIEGAHWVGDPAASNGLSSLVPPRAVVDGKETFGWFGVLTGAGVVFFAYIGFDAVSTTAQECKNPTRDLPIGIIGSLVICTVLYILMAMVMTGVVHFSQLGVPDPVAVGIDAIVAKRAWSSTAGDLLGFAVKVGALAGLTSVILVSMLGQTRIFYVMSRDGLLPWFKNVHPKYQTPHHATMLTGVFVAVCGGCMPLTLVGELVSIGTLLAFMLVCLCILILRIRHPEIRRPFKTPVYWLVAPLGAAACVWVMYGLPLDTWLRLIIWLAIGFAIYFTYGVKHSRLRSAGK
jgi:APA family basic amino acid/polyamine antiporter